MMTKRNITLLVIAIVTLVIGIVAFVFMQNKVYSPSDGKQDHDSIFNSY